MTEPSRPVWLLHGWAANNRVFDLLLQQFPLPARRFFVTPNLPGHGGMLAADPFDIETAADTFAARIDEPVHLLGWSLGGMIAAMIAVKYPEKIASLCLTAVPPKLEAASDYPEGLTRRPLDAMVASFEQDYENNMYKFLALQTLYAPTEIKTEARRLAHIIAAAGAPTGLQGALDAVNHADIRSFLPDIRCPSLLVYGARDALVPPRIGGYMHRHIAGSRLEILPQEAHTPFVGNPKEFARLLTNFWEEI